MPWTGVPDRPDRRSLAQCPQTRRLADTSYPARWRIGARDSQALQHPNVCARSNHPRRPYDTRPERSVARDGRSSPGASPLVLPARGGVMPRRIPASCRPPATSGANPSSSPKITARIRRCAVLRYGSLWMSSFGKTPLRRRTNWSSSLFSCASCSPFLGSSRLAGDEWVPPLRNTPNGGSPGSRAALKDLRVSSLS